MLLVTYDCSYTLYFGPLIGASWVQLSSLQTLTLSGNSYNSPVPTEIASLPSLSNFYIQDTALTGDLSFLPLMTNIFEFWVDFNPLMGATIPTDLGSLPQFGEYIQFPEMHHLLETNSPSTLQQVSRLQNAVWLDQSHLKWVC